MPTNPLDLTNHKISETYERVVQTSSNKLYDGLGAELFDLTGILRTSDSYTDPTWLVSLAASKITQSTSYRFVTDSEKLTWNGKQNSIMLGNTSQYFKGDLSLGNISDLIGGGAAFIEVIDYVYSLIGNVDGINTYFVLTNNFVPGTLKIYIDGILQTLGALYDYVETGINGFTLNLAPISGTNITAQYLKENGSVSPEKIDYVYDLTGAVDGVNDTFTLTYNFKIGTLKVYVDGIFQTKGSLYDYEEIGLNQIIFNRPPLTGSNVTAIYTL